MAPRKNTHLREIPSIVYREEQTTKEFQRFFIKRVLPRLKLTGYKPDEKEKIAAQAVQQVISAGLAGACVADTRDTSLPGVRMRRNVWNAIVAADLAKASIGSESTRKTTRYQATHKLLSLKKEWTLGLFNDSNLERNTEMQTPTRHALVVITKGKIDLATGRLNPDSLRRKPVSLIEHVTNNAQRDADGKPDPRAIKNGLAYFRKIEDQIEAINRANLEHSWQAFYVYPETGRKYVFQPDPRLTQVHSGDGFRATRLYTHGERSGQNLSEDMRQRMLIDCEPTAELDFSGMAPRLAYHLYVGASPMGDIYRPQRVFPTFYGFDNVTRQKKAIIRDFVKRATNICLNVSTRSKANSAVSKLLMEHEESDFLQKVTYKTEGLDSPSDVMGRITKVHPRLREYLFTEIGIELMSVDGKIMLALLTRLVVESQIPILAIHDSIVCRQSDVEKAKQAMTDTYRSFTVRFSPKIRRVF